MFAPKSKKSEPTLTSSAPAAPELPRREPEIEPATSVSAVPNVIGKGTVIEGNIIAEGDLTIEGTVRGDVTTKSTLIIGPTCIVEGNILADHAEVAGQVKGTVQALGLLVIKSSSMIDGDVLTKNLNVESGSTFNGRFSVGAVTSSNASVRKTDTPKADAPKADSSVLGGDIKRPAPAAVPAPAKV